MGTIFYGDARHPDDAHRETIRLSPSIPLHFVFETADRPPLNRTWIDLLAQSASGPAGLHVVPNLDDVA